MLNLKEKIVFFLLLLFFISSFSYVAFLLYTEHTTKLPAQGGVYKEGLLKTSEWLVLNPLYTSRSDAERDIMEVLYSGMMRYNKEGDIVPELIDDYEIKENRIFDIRLKEDLFWSDGERITAEDVVFTVKSIQDPTFKSTLQESWAGVSVEKMSKLEVRFMLDSSSSVFMENLTLKIIPKHVWSSVSTQDFIFSNYNIEVVGSGPYKYKEKKENSSGEVTSLVLQRNPYYFKKPPYIDEVHFNFYGNRESILEAKRKKEIDGFAVSGEEYPFHRYDFSLPRYFAVMFNMESEGAVSDLKVRQALNYATDKEEIIKKVINGEAVHSPLLLHLYGKEKTENPYPYHREKAKELLKEAGFEDGMKVMEEKTVHVFSKDMKEGDQGEEVRALQRCLISEEIYTGEVTGYFDTETEEAVKAFQERYSEEILDPWGFQSGTGSVSTTTREKLNELCSKTPETVVPLEIELVTVNQPVMKSIAEEIRRQWRAVGVDVKIIEEEIHLLEREVIRPRNYDSLLFGTAMKGKINPLPLWHSSKTEDPGLNLSGYSNPEADTIMEKIISGTHEKEDLFELEEKIMEEAPAVFLYNPYFTYYVSNKVKGIEESFLADSSKRLQNIEEWYMRTKRTF